MQGKEVVQHGLMSVGGSGNDQNVEDVKKTDSDWTEIEIVGNSKNLSPKLWTLTHLTGLYLSDNGIQRLPPEISRLKHLLKLDLSKNKLRSLPAELGDMIELRDLNLSYNSLRVLPNELGRLYQLKSFGLSGNPLPNEILGLAGETNGVSKLLMFMLDNLTVCPRPPPREWIPLAPNAGKQGSFTVMSYNVLCDNYATRQLYGYCPSWALSWDYRKTAILKEILQFNADLLSLQEVETEQFWSFFMPELSKNGYKGIFNPKSRAKTMTEEERRYVDGCAIFWHTSKFELIKEHLVEFNQIAASHAEGADDMVNRVMQRDNIGVMALLEMVDTVPELGNIKPHIVVANAHIHWDPEFCDVKLIQTVMLMSEIKSFMEEVKPSFSLGGKTPNQNLPIILCADMNSLLDSGAIEFLEKGRISVNHPDFQKLAYSGFFSRHMEKENGKKATELTHPFKIKRAGEENTLPFTNFTYEFTGILDYIFYSHEMMLPLGELGRVDQDYLAKNKVIGFPHPHFPSDHIPLVVEFEYTNTNLAKPPTSASPVTGYPR